MDDRPLPSTSLSHPAPDPPVEGAAAASTEHYLNGTQGASRLGTSGAEPCCTKPWDQEWRVESQNLEEEIARRKQAEAQVKTLLKLIAQERSALETLLKQAPADPSPLSSRSGLVEWSTHLCEMKLLALQDGLTQVANRCHLEQYLEQQWRQMSREQTWLSLLLCDIDCFRQYNSTYGAAAGDRCLKQVAQAISESLKRPFDLIARYGGEEFLAVLPKTNCAGALVVAQRIQDAIAALEISHATSSVSSQITLSLGIACIIPNPGVSLQTLTHAAEQQLQTAKAKGRDRFMYQVIPI